MSKKGGTAMFAFFVSLFAIGYILSCINTPGKAGEKRKREQERKQLRYDIYKATRR